MDSVKVLLRRRRGRGWDYRQIEIPTDPQMERIAAELHEKMVPAITTVLGWRVLYIPSCPLNYSTTKVDPITGESGDVIHHETHTISYCVFGYESEWQVCYSWNHGDEQPPTRIQERGDVVPASESSQGTLFKSVRQAGTPLPVPYPDEVVPDTAFREGAVIRVLVNAYERNPEARRTCIQHYGTSCHVCGFNFKEAYGPEADGMIHVHHLRPLAEVGAEYEIDPIADLRPVCPNCHLVLHSRNPVYSIDEVRQLMKRKRTAEQADSVSPR